MNYKEFISLYLKSYSKAEQKVKYVLFVRNYNDYSYFEAKGINIYIYMYNWNLKIIFFFHILILLLY